MSDALETLRALEETRLDEARASLRLAEARARLAEEARARLERERDALDARLHALRASTASAPLELARRDAYHRALREDRARSLEALDEATLASEEAERALDEARRALGLVRASARAIELRIAARDAALFRAAEAKLEDELDELGMRAEIGRPRGE